MHPGLMDFKHEVEQELLQAKNIWYNSFYSTFYQYAPLPGIAPYATGWFLNQTQSRIDGTINRFNLNPESFKAKINNDDYYLKKNKKIPRNYTQINKFSSGSKQGYKIKNPYSYVSITNTVKYNINIETTGWTSTNPYSGKIKNTPPYKTFKMATKYATEELNRFLMKQYRGKQRSPLIESVVYNRDKR